MDHWAHNPFSIGFEPTKYILSVRNVMCGMLACEDKKCVCHAHCVRLESSAKTENKVTLLAQSIGKKKSAQAK